MEITAVAAMSMNGFISRGKAREGSYAWASPEDQELFYSMRDEATLIVMGRKTYDDSLPFIKLTPKTLRVVMTRHPQDFTEVEGQLEFKKEEPAELIARLKNLGHEKMLLVGGGEMFALFLEYIDYLILTVEPLVFTEGTPLVQNAAEKNVQFQLEEFKQLNERGTTLQKFKHLR